MRVMIRCRPQKQRNTSSFLLCTIMASVAISYCCTAFTTVPIRQSKITQQLRAAPRTHLFEHHDKEDSRRRPKQRERQHKTVHHNFPNVISATFSAIVISSTTLCLPSPVVAGLLDEYGAGITINTPTSAAAGTGTDKSTSTSKTSSTNISGGNGVQIDPTLRGSYYYPTAKKRYLPRILKASDALEILPEELTTIASRNDQDDSIDWERLLELVATVDDAVLPLQLYQSSLTGQGLSLNNDYATYMKSAALRYERSAKQLATIFQINSKNKNPSSVKSIASNSKTQEKIQLLLVELKDAMNEYRVQGRLTNTDNINIPSATPEEMRRMAMRNRNIVQISDK